MDRVCPFREMICTERCALNLLGSCAFESLRGIEDALRYPTKGDAEQEAETVMEADK